MSDLILHVKCSKITLNSALFFHCMHSFVRNCSDLQQKYCIIAQYKRSKISNICLKSACMVLCNCYCDAGSMEMSTQGKASLYLNFMKFYKWLKTSKLNPRHKFSVFRATIWSFTYSFRSMSWHALQTRESRDYDFQFLSSVHRTQSAQTTAWCPFWPSVVRASALRLRGSLGRWHHCRCSRATWLINYITLAFHSRAVGRVQPTVSRRYDALDHCGQLCP